MPVIVWCVGDGEAQSFANVCGFILSDFLGFYSGIYC